MTNGLSIRQEYNAATVIAVAAFIAASVFFGIYIKNNMPVLDILPGGGQTATTTSVTGAVQPALFEYLEVLDGCGPYYDTGTCVNMRSGPGIEFPVVERLRTGIVLRVEKEVTTGDIVWDKIKFDNEIKYPDRLPADIYVAAEFVHNFYNDGNHELVKGAAPTAKRIVVDLSDQMLYAYDGDALFMKESVSTGLELTPTNPGTFTVFKMTPARYMQGPIPEVSDQVYDLPGVPWNLYFTADGAVIHGAYWHDHFGEPWSHGCVNLPPQKAKELYMWAEVGTKVTVQE